MEGVSEVEWNGSWCWPLRAEVEVRDHRYLVQDVVVNSPGGTTASADAIEESESTTSSSRCPKVPPNSLMVVVTRLPPNSYAEPMKEAGGSGGNKKYNLPNDLKIVAAGELTEATSIVDIEGNSRKEDTALLLKTWA